MPRLPLRAFPAWRVLPELMPAVGGRTVPRASVRTSDGPSGIEAGEPGDGPFDLGVVTEQAFLGFDAAHGDARGDTGPVQPSASGVTAVALTRRGGVCSVDRIIEPVRHRLRPGQHDFPGPESDFCPSSAQVVRAPGGTRPGFAPWVFGFPVFLRPAPRDPIPRGHVELNSAYVAKYLPWATIGIRRRRRPSSRSLLPPDRRGRLEYACWREPVPANGYRRFADVHCQGGLDEDPRRPSPPCRPGIKGVPASTRTGSR
jgi:hypothetical protein